MFPTSDYQCRHLSRDEKVVRSILETLDSPRALTVWMLFYYKEHDQLIKLEIDPLHYCDPIAFDDDYTATELLSKAKFLQLSSDPLEEAVRRFELAESMCRETNLRIARATCPSTDERPPDWFWWVTNSAQRYIAQVLGEINTRSLCTILRGCCYGPGATLSLPKHKASRYEKLRSKPQCTKRSLPLAQIVVNSHGYWASSALNSDGVCSILKSGLEVVDGNRVTFVPKNAKTHRAIAIEPVVNAYLQSGIGRYIRRRLQKFGTDLDDQTVNQRLAKEGSLLGNLATIDLSMASDTVSREVVSLLLPEKWVGLMDDARSRSFLLGTGQTRRYEKWSSMGNGYTFEMESLIFKGLCHGVQSLNPVGYDGVTSVYGDDIICPSSMANILLEVLEYFGFKRNQKKTFVTSLFRESCGEHYFGGYKCKPTRIEDSLVDDDSIICLHNRLWERAQHSPHFFEERFVPVMLKLRNTLYEKAHEGHPDLGDGVLFPLRSLTRISKTGFVRYRCVSYKSRKRKLVEYYPSLGYALAEIGSDNPSNGFHTLPGKSDRRVIKTDYHPFYVPWLNDIC